MKDRFKFRMYDKTLNSYVDLKADNIYGFDIYCISDPRLRPHDENFIIEQCVPLSDCNGRLAFVGDTWISNISNKANGVIEFDEEAYCFNFGTSRFVYDQEDMCFSDGEFEITGTIHDKQD